MEIREFYNLLAKNREEVLAKILQNKDVHAFVSLASESNMTINEETAKIIMDTIAEFSESISDEELDKVVGGVKAPDPTKCGGSYQYSYKYCAGCSYRRIYDGVGIDHTYQFIIRCEKTGADITDYLRAKP